MPLETIGVLFTDLVGSTELSVRIGPGPSEVLRKEHFALLGGACATAGGREVKNLGDGLMLVFSSASRAVDAAVTAQQAIDARNRRSDLRFDVRMGIALGEVNAENGDYFGEPVVQAARLCALAEGGQILVTDVARLLARSTPHGFAPVGALDLKGLPEPVLAHMVTWEPSTGPGIPVPLRLRGSAGAYVGRDAERRTLDTAWEAAVGGRSGLVLVCGEPGIGKTSLAVQHALGVHEAGGTVLYGAVDEGLGVPYQPWIEAIGHYVDHAPDVLLARYVADSGADLARLLPALPRRMPDLPALSRSDGETERYLLFEAVGRMLRAAAADNPVLIVLDDLHWADKPTLLLLAHLHRAVAEAPVLFVATYRDSDLTSEHSLTDSLAALRREERVTRLSLSGLGTDELVDLLRRTSGQEPGVEAHQLAQMLGRDTNGNPLFVAEVLRDLLETGRLAVGDDGLWALATDIDELAAPASVREVVAQRVGRLGTEATRVLATAAVIGREFELELLADVLDRERDDVLEIVEAAMAASLLTEMGARAGDLQFIHALIAQSLVDGLSALRRSQIHRTVATSIERLYGPDLGDRVGSVAGHLLAAGEGAPKIVDYTRRAGRHALAALAPDEALRWFRTAHDILVQSDSTDDALRCDLLTDIGEAMRDAGLPGARDQLIDAARLAERLGDGDGVARAVLALGRSIAASLGSTDEEIISAIEAALALRTEHDGIRARLLAMLGAEVMVYEALERRRALVDEALVIARGLDEITLARVLVSSLGALWTASMLESRVRIVDELVGLQSVVTDPQVRAFTAMHGAWAALEAADRPALERYLVDARDACAASGQPATHWLLHVIESIVARLNGDLAAADRQAEAGLAVATDAGLQDGFLLYSAHVISQHLAQGRLGELSGLIEDAMRANPNVRTFRPVLSVALADGGDLDGACAQLDAELASGLDGLPESNTWSVGVSSLGRVANLAHRTDAAATLYPLAARVADVLVTTGATSSSHMSTVLGLLATTLGRRDAAVAHFNRAAELLDAFGAPLMLARNHYEHARSLLELGEPIDRDRARDLLGDAAAINEGHDCPTQVAQCEALLASMG